MAGYCSIQVDYPPNASGVADALVLEDIKTKVRDLIADQAFMESLQGAFPSVAKFVKEIRVDDNGKKKKAKSGKRNKPKKKSAELNSLASGKSSKKGKSIFK